MGLTRAALIEMSGLGKTTIYEIENGDLKNLGFIKANQVMTALGLELSVRNAGSESCKNSALSRAAVFASLEQRKQIDLDNLRRVLTVETYLGDYEPYLRQLLLNADVALLGALADQLHQENRIECSETWKRMRALAKRLSVVRPLWR